MLELQRTVGAYWNNMRGGSRILIVMARKRGTLDRAPPQLCPATTLSRYWMYARGGRGEKLQGT